MEAGYKNLRKIPKRVQDKHILRSRQTQHTTRDTQHTSHDTHPTTPPGRLFRDALEALRVGRALGERVVVLGVSTGGGLAAWLAAREKTPGDAAADESHGSDADSRSEEEGAALNRQPMGRGAAG